MYFILFLQKLAKFHASALAVKLKDPRLFDELTESMKEIIYDDPSDMSVVKTSTDLWLKIHLKYLEIIEPRTQELQAIIDHMATYIDNTYDRFYRMFNGPKQKYYTICHGDPWANNLLFLHDNDARIIDMKMVDYQVNRHFSLATDIHYLIYSSARSSLIERSYESLIKIYHTEFLKELRRLHVDEKILAELDAEWLKTELQTYAFHGGIVGCFF